MIEDFTPRRLPVIEEKYKLQEPTSKVTEDDDVDQLKELLFLNLREHGGIGLAANQIGIDRRICVVDVKEPFALVNPELVAMGGRTTYVESCLSFMDDTFKTERYVEIEVEADNFGGSLVFGPPPDSFEPEEPEDLDDPTILESVAVQHELDHLNGKTVHQRKLGRNETFVATGEIGRNEKVVMENGDGDQATVKFKHADKLREDGYEITGQV